MESIGRWVDLAADRPPCRFSTISVRCSKTSTRTAGGCWRAMRERARARRHADCPWRWRRGFDAVRVVRSCLTLERRLLRDRGVDLDFTTTLETMYVRGRFECAVRLATSASCANAAENEYGPAGAGSRHAGAKRGKELQLVRPGRPRARRPRERCAPWRRTPFSGTVTVDSPSGDTTTLTIVLPLPPPQREEDRRS